MIHPAGMFDPEAELEAEMEDASESTSDGEDDDDDDDDDDTTISISDPEDGDVDKLSLDVDKDDSGGGGGGVREASPVFYIDPEEWPSSNGEQQHDETLTEKAERGAKQNSDGVKKATSEDVDEDVALLRNVLCSPLSRMRSVSMMSASPPPPPSPTTQPAHAHHRLRRPNSIVSRNLEFLAGNSICLGSPDSAAAATQQPRSLLRERMRKTAIPLLGALVRPNRGRPFQTSQIQIWH